MNLLKSMMIAAAGMSAQGSRMRVIAENLANANSTAESKNSDPYRRRVPTFKNELDRNLGVDLVKMDKVVTDKSAFGTRFDPGHPAADAQGYVKTPNVNGLVEMMDMKDAQRSYEAGLNVINAARGMMARTIDLLRS
jgi:flagellar basal-body rod protein FlgC